MPTIHHVWRHIGSWLSGSRSSTAATGWERDQNWPVIREFHRQIIRDAAAKLGRDLTAEELQFITSRGGCIALEMIHDEMKFGTTAEIERYLNQERSSGSS